MKSLAKSYVINAPQSRVFKALTLSEWIVRWSGKNAFIEPFRGGHFSLWNDEIYGKIRKLSENKIVLDWYKKDWLRPTFVTFLLTENDGITHLEIIHEEIPERDFHDVNTSWDQKFMSPLIDLLENTHH